jgi:hypothetical protein
MNLMDPACGGRVNPPRMWRLKIPQFRRAHRF